MELQGLSKIGRRVTRGIVFFFFFFFGVVSQAGGEEMTTMWALLGLLAMHIKNPQRLVSKAVVESWIVRGSYRGPKDIPQLT